MNVLRPISAEQDLTFIPRKMESQVILALTFEGQGETVTTEQYPTLCDGGYMTIEIQHDFSEGQNYTFQVKDLDDNLLYRGKIFCTDQEDLENYNVNNDLLTA